MSQPRRLPGRARSLIPKVSTVVQSHKPQNRVCINVGGVRFETFKSTLKNIPDTRLSWLTESSNHSADYDPIAQEYFFDRHPGVFNMILNYYRTGKLHCPTDVCGPMFEEELAFWGIDETQLEACCWTQYRTHREAEQTLAKFDTGEESEDETVEFAEVAQNIEQMSDKKPCSRWERLKPRAWTFLEDPNSSIAAKVYAIVSFVFVLLSVATLSLETHILFRVSTNYTLYGPPSWNWTYFEKMTKSKPHPSLEIIEYVCVAFFTLEVILRFIFCPTKLQFIKGPLNWVDIMSILPFYIEKIILSVSPDKADFALLHFFKIIRLIRVFRIFKLTRHFTGLKILFHSIKASAKELLLLIIFLCLSVLIFASLIYYAEAVEGNSNNDFSSIPIGFWWAVVTMTTLGYGDIFPRTALGYLVGSICAIAGVLVLALPVPVIVNNFAVYYSHAQARLKLPKKTKKTLVGAADALKTQTTFPGEAGYYTDNELESSASSRCSSAGSGFPNFSDESSASNGKSSDKSAKTSQDSGINGEFSCSNDSIVHTDTKIVVQDTSSCNEIYPNSNRLYHKPWSGTLSPVQSIRIESPSPTPQTNITVEYIDETPCSSPEGSSCAESRPNSAKSTKSNNSYKVRRNLPVNLTPKALRRRTSFKPINTASRRWRKVGNAMLFSLNSKKEMTDVDI